MEINPRPRATLSVAMITLSIQGTPYYAMLTMPAVLMPANYSKAFSVGNCPEISSIRGANAGSTNLGYGQARARPPPQIDERLGPDKVISRVNKGRHRSFLSGIQSEAPSPPLEFREPQIAELVAQAWVLPLQLEADGCLKSIAVSEVIERGVDRALTIDGVFLVRPCIGATGADACPGLVIVGVDINTGHVDTHSAKEGLVKVGDTIDRGVDHEAVFTRPVVAVVCSKAKTRRQAV